MPTFREASDLALRAKVAILERSGALKDDGAAKTPLADVVTAVAKQFEGDPAKRNTSGEPVAWTRQNVAGEAALEAAVFEGEIGKLLGPVRSNVGWHVILVEERRPAPSYDEVKVQVREDLLRVAIRRFQLQLRSDDEIILGK
jgi:parvulin-like peptidyl-prolyl isomerase